jgi:peptidoglycan hydrolase CwlO-like protein
MDDVYLKSIYKKLDSLNENVEKIVKKVESLQSDVEKNEILNTKIHENVGYIQDEIVKIEDTTKKNESRYFQVAK